jgi:hypothetical protein
MAAKPIERFVKKQIAEQGGWDRILERIGSGESISAIAQTFLRPDHHPISFAFFSRLLHQDPEREPAIREAKRLRAEAWADRALAVSDTCPADRDAVAKARVQIETRLRLAGLADREQYGERKHEINVQVNTAEVHLDALRHRHVLEPSVTDTVQRIAVTQAHVETGVQEVAVDEVKRLQAAASK